MSDINQSIRKLMKQHNMSMEDAAQAMGLDSDAVRMALASGCGGNRPSTMTIQEMVDEFKPTALMVLKDIICDGDADNRDKIAACKIILQGDGVLPDLNANDMSERIKRMKVAMGLASVVDNIIDVEGSLDQKQENHLQLVAS